MQINEIKNRSLYNFVYFVQAGSNLFIKIDPLVNNFSINTKTDKLFMGASIYSLPND